MEIPRQEGIQGVYSPFCSHCEMFNFCAQNKSETVERCLTQMEMVLKRLMALLTGCF